MNTKKTVWMEEALNSIFISHQKLLHGKNASIRAFICRTFCYTSVHHTQDFTYTASLASLELAQNSSFDKKKCVPESKFPYLKHLDSDVTATREAWASYSSYWISAKNLNQSPKYADIVLVVFFKDEDECKLLDHIHNNVIVISIISFSEMFNLGFRSVELLQYTAPTRGNKVLGQVSLLGQYQAFGQKIFPKNPCFKKRKKRGFGVFFFKQLL